jgi:hypothetical protein
MGYKFVVYLLLLPPNLFFCVLTHTYLYRNGESFFIFSREKFLSLSLSLSLSAAVLAKRERDAKNIPSFEDISFVYDSLR